MSNPLYSFISRYWYLCDFSTSYLDHDPVHHVVVETPVEVVPDREVHEEEVHPGVLPLDHLHHVEMINYVRRKIIPYLHC